MSNTIRFSVSIDDELLDRFDSLSGKRGYGNRSEALRDIIREALVREEWEGNEEIVGTVTIVYDHHQRELSEKLTDIQHNEYASVLSNLHIHLDHDNCLEVIVVKGAASSVQRIADNLIMTRGVKHGTLSATTTGRRLS
jgi:CopG family nickel-responsive transcriptional regulator